MIKYFKLIRVKQWTKNLFCFSGFIFGTSHYDYNNFLQSFKSFLCFCLISSFVYIINDLFDKESDSKHPKKKNRPIASGTIKTSVAKIFAIILFTVGIFVASNINYTVFCIVLLYLINNLFYNIYFKKLVIIDVLSIALGFIFRLIAGIYSVMLIPTPWIVLCTFFLAMFLGFSKRRAELIKSEENFPQRPVLKNYSVQFLDSLINDSAFGSIISYSIFCTINHNNYIIIITIPVVYYALMHYKNLIFQNIHGEEPESVVLKDRTILVSIIVWLILYFLFKSSTI